MFSMEVCVEGAVDVLGLQWGVRAAMEVGCGGTAGNANTHGKWHHRKFWS